MEPEMSSRMTRFSWGRRNSVMPESSPIDRKMSGLWGCAATVAVGEDEDEAAASRGSGARARE